MISCTEELILKAAGHAKERGALLQAHMNEYPNEINFFLQRFGVRPIEYLEKLGVLDERFLAAHCILLSENEKDLLKKYNEEHNATVIISSHNLNHTVDVCPRIAVLEHGVIIRDLVNENNSAEKELEDYFNVEEE